MKPWENWQDSLARCSSPFVSVVVCTRGRPAALVRCVESIFNVSYDNYEVVVVDNAPLSANGRPAGLSKAIRYVREPKTGSGFARAAGVRLARGEIVAMTDDDCVVDPMWLKWLVAGFDDASVMCCTGLVSALEIATPAQRILETFCSYAKGPTQRAFGGPGDEKCYLSPQEVGTGANMAFRRQVFELIGPFDGALGAGTPAQGGEELDVFSRILRLGGRILYEPRALVKHEHPRDHHQLRRSFFKYGIGYNAFMTKLALTVKRREVLGAAIARNRFWYGWAKHSLKQRLLGIPHMPLDLLLAYLLGSVLGPIGYFRSLRRARELERNTSVNSSEWDLSHIGTRTEKRPGNQAVKRAADAR